MHMKTESVISMKESEFYHMINYNIYEFDAVSRKEVVVSCFKNGLDSTVQTQDTCRHCDYTKHITKREYSIER